MKRLLALLVVSMLVLILLAGCSGSDDATLETVGEGAPTEGRPVFYEFFTQG
ncbi:MAG: hypothetical protein U1F44_05060 [Coriobacteriia bacterium]|nr:hypothetical protein [Coriobacteriia bacterium]